MSELQFLGALELELRGPFGESQLEARLGERVTGAARPTAVRIEGRFADLHVRSVPRQRPPYRPLAERSSSSRSARWARRRAR